MVKDNRIVPGITTSNSIERAQKRATFSPNQQETGFMVLLRSFAEIYIRRYVNDVFHDVHCYFSFLSELILMRYISPLSTRAATG